MYFPPTPMQVFYSIPVSFHINKIYSQFQGFTYTPTHAAPSSESYVHFSLSKIYALFLTYAMRPSQNTTTQTVPLPGNNHRYLTILFVSPHLNKAPESRHHVSNFNVHFIKVVFQFFIEYIFQSFHSMEIYIYIKWCK